MTAQFTEVINYKGEKHSLCSCPLSDYFYLAKVNSPFVSFTTANWRGYFGEWEIKNNRLYLVGLRGNFPGEGEPRPAMLDIFPDYPERVFAHWYSGELRIPKGEQLEYVHMGFGSKYEQDILIKIRQGMVVEEKIRKNADA